MATLQKSRSACPVVFALDIFGDRWTLLIVRDLCLHGFSTYGEFLRAGEGIATNILAERLARLEDHGIVTKQDDPDHGAKFRYRLTKQGLELVPILVEMIRWSVRHDRKSPVSKTHRLRLEHEPQKVVDEIVQRARAARPGPQGADRLNTAGDVQRPRSGRSNSKSTDRLMQSPRTQTSPRTA